MSCSTAPLELPQPGDAADDSTHLLPTQNDTGWFVFVLKQPQLQETHLLSLTCVCVPPVKAQPIPSPVRTFCWAGTLLSANHLHLLSFKGGYVYNLYGNFNSSYYSPAPLLLAVIQNLLTTAASCWTATGNIIILRARLFYLPPSPFTSSTGANEDAFLITIRQRKRTQSVHVGLHACSTYGSRSHCGVWWEFKCFFFPFLNKSSRPIFWLQTPTHRQADSWGPGPGSLLVGFNLRPI